jgi:hypothetical protein
MAGGLDREELRQLVRDVLRSSLQDETVALPTAEPTNLIEAMRQAILPGQSGTVAVADDLNRFARDIVQAAGHEDLKAAIMTGRVTFSCKNAGPGEARPVAATARGEPFRLDRGMLTEMRIGEIGKQYSKVIVGPEVVVTPLARDRARELKLELVRSKT